MATCRATVNTALRKLGRLAAGREPRAADTTDAMDALRGMYGAWVAGGAFGRLADVVPLSSPYTTSGNERVFRSKQADELVVNLPELMSGARFDDYGWCGRAVMVVDAGITILPGQVFGYCATPRDGSVVAISDAVCGETATFIYDGTIKQWQQIDALALDDEAPRSAGDPQGLAACLAMEISDQFGADVLAGTQMQAARFKAAMTSRFSMPRTETVGCYF